MQACKPGSVSPPEAEMMIIYLALALLPGSCNLPVSPLRTGRSY